MSILLEEEEGPSKAFVAAVKLNVEEWLTNHIRTWDREVADFLKNRS